MAKSSPGAFALSEILSQPLCWRTCLTELRDNRTLSRIAEQLGGKRNWLFVGCGSSFYVALSAASTLTALTGMPARAVPASEILLFPQLTLVGRGLHSRADLALRTHLGSLEGG